MPRAIKHSNGEIAPPPPVRHIAPFSSFFPAFRQAFHIRFRMRGSFHTDHRTGLNVPYQMPNRSNSPRRMPDLNQVPPSRGRSTCQYEQCTGSLAVSPNHHHLRPPESGPPLTHAVTEHDMRTQRRRAPFCPRQPFLLMEWRL